MPPPHYWDNCLESPLSVVFRQLEIDGCSPEPLSLGSSQLRTSPDFTGAKQDFPSGANRTRQKVVGNGYLIAPPHQRHNRDQEQLVNISSVPITESRL